jgi:D-alanyl-D-alanine carboxypeptidase
VPILAKGKEGSWWETPVGLYAIQSREENHFSSFGEVYQPWSLGFQGNFFIHGWPYYKSGEPVASTYSGGCIRLSTEDARALFEFSAVGMPVLVYNTPPKSTSFQYRFKTPDIEATAFAAVDLSDGTVLAGENVSIQLPIASVTKLMSALIAVEYLNLERQVAVPRDALVETTVPRLLAGRAYSVHDLLILMLTESSNEAAETLAAALGRDYFIELMNSKARAIGMQRTSFIDPSGLGVGNSSTAEDMFTLAKYLYENRRFVLNITNESLQDDAYGEVVFRNLSNFNDIPDVPNAFLGGKIGQTAAARETYLGIFGLEVDGKERPIVVVILGAQDSQRSVAILLKYLNEFYDLNPEE